MDFVFRALTLVYNRLKINLPRLVEELELNEDFSEQLLQGLALVEEDMCSQSMVSSPGSLIENQTISRVNVEGSLKSLKLARSKVDVLLQQVNHLDCNRFPLHFIYLSFSLAADVIILSLSPVLIDCFHARHEFDVEGMIFLIFAGSKPAPGACAVSTRSPPYGLKLYSSESVLVHQ